MVQTTCSQCGKEIKRKPYCMKKDTHHFCSMNCYHHWLKENALCGKEHPRWKQISTVCDQCGRKIDKHPAKTKLAKHHFCSKICFNKWKAENPLKGKNSPLWNKILVHCDFCNETFYVSKYLTKQKHHFCDRNCYANWRRENAPVGRDNFQWNRITKNCDYCGVKINILPCKIKQKNHFCSKECHVNWQRENALFGKDNGKWNRIVVYCDNCGKKLCRVPSRIKLHPHQFCSRSCLAEWEKKNWVGEQSPTWDGGKFPYYGKCWAKQKKEILKRAKYVSEISGNNGGLLDIHHIIPIKKIVQKYINMCYISMPSIKTKSFKILPYNSFIPDIIFEEANQKSNLICVTKREHRIFEGMPPTFFDAIRNK